MSLLLFADNASATLASGISDSATTIVVSAGEGSVFSAPGAGEYALGTLEDVNGNIEVVQITSKTGDSFVVVRAQEGTSAIAFASGTIFEQRVTAGMLEVFLQKFGGDTLSGTTILSGVLNLGSGGSIQLGETAGTPMRSQPGDTSNQIRVPIGSPATAAGSVILTTAIAASNLPSGFDFVHTGMIVMWSGSVGSIPSGWVLCDGDNGTPDLRDVFIVGGGGSMPTSGGSSSLVTSATDPSGGFTLGATVLTLDQIPGHTHQFWSGSVLDFGGSGGGPALTVGSSGGYVTNIPASGGTPANTPFIQASGGSSQGNVAAANAHTHAFSGTLNHTHGYQYPPYKAVFMIMKQ